MSGNEVPSSSLSINDCYSNSKTNQEYFSLKPEFKVFRNWETGEYFVADCSPTGRSLIKLKRSCSALNRIQETFGLCYSFCTLTLDNDHLSAGNKVLNRFLTWMRTKFKRTGLPFFNLWVLEVQERRYRKYGQMALHWHVAFLCPDGCLPEVQYFDEAPHYRVIREGLVIKNADLVKRWGLGIVMMERAKNQKNIFRYMEKYLSKSYGSFREYNPNWSSLRRFGCSRLGVFGLRKGAYEYIQDLYTNNPGLRDYCFKLAGKYLRFYKESKDLVSGCTRRELAHEYKYDSPWGLACAIGKDGVSLVPVNNPNGFGLVWRNEANAIGSWRKDKLGKWQNPEFDEAMKIRTGEVDDKFNFDVTYSDKWQMLRQGGV